jgi:amino acid adenylation domain-containing protein
MDTHLVNSSTKPDDMAFVCVPELVQRRAALAPNALAVRAGSDCLTYQELNARSNQLAHFLCGLGVAPGSVVGLCLDHSVAFPVAALAILKAGAAYLPLEPKTPPDRLNVMLNGARASAVVTHSSLVGSLRGNERRVVALDCDAKEIALCSCDPPPVAVRPQHLAYVIYTSGSTGTPKAVAIGHNNLLNLIRWHNRSFGVTAQDIASQLASIGFDAAVWEIWPYLVTGASVHLVDDETRTEAELLRDWLVNERITISFVPTPLAERMMKLPWPAKTTLRFLLTGADTLHHYPPASLPFRVVNNYGPTECTVVATSATVPAQASEDRLPPIGRPIDDTNIYILGSDMKQVPVGKIGEMYIGGASVGKGYLNDLELTAERFVRDPFSGTGEARLYRTGDLACWLPDGQIAFHGRIDDQVKIRGHRIELNEIIGALDRYPGVRASVVVACEDGMGDKRLVAYIVPQDSAPTITDLRDFLGKELPTYMIPSTFVALDAIPLGANGKVNRSALPAPSDENMLRDEAFVRARTPTEQRVAEIVGSLLGIDSIGVSDNFFYLGGNSLFGTQVIARLRQSFDIELPLLRLFDCPTVEALAAEVERLLVARLEDMSEEEAQRLLALNAEQPSS